MAWYDEAVFYHIYPLGLTGAPRQNSYGTPVHRLRALRPWISHIRNLGCSALYIGPLFESVGHGYETTDYKRLDSRLGTNEDLTSFVQECHRQGIRVILDGVFNHTGRDFFAFRDLLLNRENSPYRDWYCGVNFWGNNEYNDGFSYENWGGYNLLVKLNQRNPAVRDYICDVIRFWVDTFDIDGIRLDAADVLDFDFMKALRHTANTVKPDFWLMGEVIHGDYSRWANHDTLHSVTNYMLHKGLYSGHNDYNYFEIAHTIRYLGGMTGNSPGGLKLYNFVDNHDVERISTKLRTKAHYAPVHILLYTLPGIPSVYYGSEFGIEGRKERGSDDSLRPSLRLEDFPPASEWSFCSEDMAPDTVSAPSPEEDAPWQIPCSQAGPVSGLDPAGCCRLISALGHIRQQTPALSLGSYEQLMLTNRQFAFARDWNGSRVIVMVNNDENPADLTTAARAAEYRGALSGRVVSAENSQLHVTLEGCSGEIWLPQEESRPEDVSSPVHDLSAAQETETNSFKVTAEPETSAPDTDLADHAEDVSESPDKGREDSPVVIPDVPYEEMTVSELQAVILRKLSQNGPLTEKMRADVQQNVWHDSLVNWAKSFR